MICGDCRGGSSMEWMLRWASVIPGGLKHDARVLKLWAYAEGMQHDEVKAGFGVSTKYLGWTWAEKKRALPAPNAVMHRTVYQRFDLYAVQLYDQLLPYRPDTLA